MTLSLDDWLSSHLAPDRPVGDPLTNGESSPVRPTLLANADNGRGTGGREAAQRALSGENVDRIVSANLAPDPLSGGDAWSTHWAQTFARHLGVGLALALLDGPVHDHPVLAQRWDHLVRHPDAVRFMGFARHDLDHHLGAAGWRRVEQRILNDQAEPIPTKERAPRPRL